IAARPEREALVELNAIVTRACQFDPRQRYADAYAMLMELELLQRGQSVQGKRRRRQFWVGFSRAGIAFACLAVVVVTILLLVRRNAASNLDPEGLPSPKLEANVICRQAMDILRTDRYQEFPQAYSNLNAALTLDAHFAKPYIG